jgi:hypothetical protein
MTFCATREFWQIRPWNKFVFNRQVRPNRYLFPISEVLNASQATSSDRQIYLEFQRIQNTSARCSLEMKATAVGTCLRRSGVYQSRQ